MSRCDNMQESALALQALQTIPHGNVFVDLVLSHKKLLPSILQAPELELKSCPNNLKYVFIGENNTLPVMVVKGCARGKTCEVVVRSQNNHWMDFTTLRALVPRCVCITYYLRIM